MLSRWVTRGTAVRPETFKIRLGSGCTIPQDLWDLSCRSRLRMTCNPGVASPEPRTDLQAGCGNAGLGLELGWA